MSQLAIKVENLSKLYRLGRVGTGSIQSDIKRWWALRLGKEDPYEKLAESNNRSQKMTSEFVWSLKDISFEVEVGKTVGIVGSNGAGKSTLLKILSQITSPTHGGFKVNGRISSLLEVGTGFNPGLTGRENIYLNGAILGMGRSEVSSLMDKIIDFSGVEGYIDTPVKRYSSGMYVRLAFSVAAHLQSNILILDEVLAVGDSEFQKKCLDKIENLCHKEGRTIVFVSHNQPIIERLCSKVFYLKNGMLHMEGATNEIMPIYMRDQYKNSSDTKTTNNIAERSRIGNGKVIITDVKFLNKKNQVVDAFTPGESLEILVNYKSISYEYKRIKNLILGVPIFNNQGIFVSDLNNKMSSHEFKDAPLEGQIAVKIPKLPLMRGLYKFGFCLEIDYALADQFVDNIELCVTEGDYYSSGYSNSLGRQGIYIDQNWTISV